MAAEERQEEAAVVPTLATTLTVRRNSGGEASIGDKRPKSTKAKVVSEVPEKKRKKDDGAKDQRSPTTTSAPKTPFAGGGMMKIAKTATVKNGVVPAMIDPVAATALPPRKPAPAKKVEVAKESNMFEQALSASSAAKSEVKKSPMKKKKAATTSNGKAGTVKKTHEPDIFDEVFNAKPPVTPQPPSVARPAPPPKMEVAEEPEVVPPGRRKIRFADEHGFELAQIRFFEIEEGERLNVNRYTPEELKHLEMNRERMFRMQQPAFVAEDDDERPKIGIPVAPQRSVRWKLIPVDVAEPLDIVPGSQSEARLTEIARQSRTIEAFWDPSNPSCHIDEPDDFDPHSAHKPIKEIPLDLIPDPAEEPPAQPQPVVLQPSPIPQIPTIPTQMPPQQLPFPSAQPAPQIPAGPTPAPTTATLSFSSTEQQKPLPPGLQNLMDRLKRQGIVQSDQANALGRPQQPNIAPTISQVPGPQHQYAQLPTYQQLPFGGGAQPQPTYAQAPGPDAGTPAPGGIHIMNIDPHSGALPPEAYAAGVPAVPFNGPVPSYPPGTRPPLRQCSYFYSGGCRFGETCHYSHGDLPTQGSRNYAASARGAPLPPRRGGFRSRSRSPRRGDISPRRDISPKRDKVEERDKEKDRHERDERRRGREDKKKDDDRKEERDKSEPPRNDDSMPAPVAVNPEPVST